MVAADIAGGEGEPVAVDRFPLISAKSDCQSLPRIHGLQAHSRADERPMTDAIPTSSRVKTVIRCMIKNARRNQKSCNYQRYDLKNVYKTQRNAQCIT